MSATPRVGVAVAVYRPDPSTFREQLRSIRAQTLENWVCVLTADSPLAPLRAEPSLAEYFADPRFVWHQNVERLGARGNFERAIGLATATGARAIACADQDDVWYPEKLAVLLEALDAAPPLSLVHADMDVLVDGVALRASAWALERRDVTRTDVTALLCRNVVTGASMLMDAALPRRHPHIPEGALHDQWYAVLASAHGGVRAVPRRLHAYRQHEANVIGVRPYRGLLDGQGVRDLFAKRAEAVANFRGRRAMARALSLAGLELPTLARVAFTGSTDAGLALGALGAASLARRPFARECFALAAGKLLDTLSRRPGL